MQAAYTTGVARTAPPDMPTRNISMMKYITACVFIVGICVFLIITLIGGLENGFPQTFQLILVVITLICIVTVLVVSYYAFQRVVRGDAETTRLLPAWDRATARWRTLYYCSRDDVVFDPATNKVMSDEELDQIRASATKIIEQATEDATMARS
jgi:hypothetical protein